MYGEKNSNLNLIKKAFPDLTFNTRGDTIKINGDKKQTQDAKSKIEQLVKVLKSQDTLNTQSVNDVLNGNLAYELETPTHSEGNQESVQANVIVYGRNARAIKARTRNQKKLVDLSEKR